jgi:hypothetical protein
MANEIAAEGQVFVCGACGKRSRDRHGAQRIDSGWDESCMLHAILCDESRVRIGADGRVSSAAAVGQVKSIECTVGFAVTPPETPGVPSAPTRRPGKREPMLTDWKLHLHRYGGRAMCGRGIGAETQDVTDDETTFNESGRQCKACRRAQDADDRKAMDRERGA